MWYNKLVSIKIPGGVYSDLESLAKEKGISIECMINKAIVCLLKKEEEK